MVEIILFIYFSANTSYLLLLSVSALFYRREVVPAAPGYKKIAIFVPCYKEDKVIVHTTEMLLKLRYPPECFDVIIMADSLKTETIASLRSTRAIVMPVTFDRSTKCKSLNRAFSQLPGIYDIAVVADADNVLSPSFLRDINDLSYAGYPIIQAQRVAKNTGTSMALLDAISEQINNHLFRQGPVALGMSSSLIGSGMAFPYQLLKQELHAIDSVAEDKVLQLAVIKKGYKIHYRKGTLVFDEKVSSAEAYKNQRKRWMASQFQSLKENFFTGLSQLFRGNLDYFHIAVWHNVFPPRIMGLFFLLMLSAVFTILYRFDVVTALRWWTMSFLYVAALLIAVPKSLYTRRLLKTLISIPSVIIKTLQALLQSNAGRKFIHTEHTTTEIDSPFINDDTMHEKSTRIHHHNQLQ